MTENTIVVSLNEELYHESFYDLLEGHYVAMYVMAPKNFSYGRQGDGRFLRIH